MRAYAQLNEPLRNRANVSIMEQMQKHGAYIFLS